MMTAIAVWMVFVAIVGVGCGIGTMLEKLVNVLAKIRDELRKR